MLESLSRMVDLLHFEEYSTQHVPRFSENDDGVNWREELEEQTVKNIDVFKTKVGPPLRILEEIDNQNEVGYFLQQMEEAANLMIQTNEDEEEILIIGEMIHHYSCLASLGFCIVSLMREAIKIENEVSQLLVWENPSCPLNFNHIYCNISNALRSQ
ncbi:hypothetical protein K1719_006591 [Acacia pycnantha]|nr:hypothetical protein K1719_006591 [Acacia pycnantha]